MKKEIFRETKEKKQQQQQNSKFWWSIWLRNEFSLIFFYSPKHSEYLNKFHPDFEHITGKQHKRNTKVKWKNSARKDREATTIAKIIFNLSAPILTDNSMCCYCCYIYWTNCN